MKLIRFFLDEETQRFVFEAVNNDDSVNTCKLPYGVSSALLSMFKNLTNLLDELQKLPEEERDLMTEKQVIPVLMGLHKFEIVSKLEYEQAQLAAALGKKEPPDGTPKN